MLRMKRLLICLLLSIASFLTYAQNTLSIYQRNGCVVSYGFADKPVVTYVEENLHVSTNNVSIDYPLSELVKMTFSDSESSIGQLRIEDCLAPILIYDINGRLVKEINEQEGNTFLNIQELPTGTYIIKQGIITAKFTKL